MLQASRFLAPAFAGLLLLAPSVLGQWTDPTGDHQVGYTPLSQFDDTQYVWTSGKESGWYPYVDVTRVSIHEETDDSVTFEVRIASDKPKGDEPAPVDYVHYEFSFVLHGQQRLLRISWPQNGNAPVGTLRTTENGTMHVDEVFSVMPTPDGPGWKVQVPKFRLRDGDLVPVRVGDRLEEVRFRDWTSLSATVSPCYSRQTRDGKCWKARDDLLGGGILGEYLISRSPPGVGHLELTSPSPLRSSNGLATTYVFEMHAHNLRAEIDQALVHLADVPSDWQVHAPTLVEIPAKSRTTFPVAVTVPFVHEHGRESYVNVSLRSRSEDVQARHTIGVVWTRIPQPSGHHAELFLHASESGFWMNTLKDDPEEERNSERGPSSYSISSGFDSFRTVLEYGAPLRPSLSLGLDFDVSRKVVADYSIKFPSPIKANISGRLVLIDEARKETILAQASLPERQFGKGETYTVHLEMPVEAAADRVPHVEETNLYFITTIRGGGSYDRTSFVTNEENFEPPRVMTVDSLIQLPLVEFREVTDESLLSALTRFSLHARTPTVKQLNPGRLAVFAFDIKNHAESAEVLQWDSIGSNTQWATVEPENVRVPGGSNATVLVTVRAPDEASDGEAAEILLLGQSRSDPNAQVYVRLIAQVVSLEAKEIDDESALADQLRGIARDNDAGAPSVSLLVALAVLCGVAWRRRAHP